MWGVGGLNDPDMMLVYCCDACKRIQAAGLGYQDVHDKPDPHAYMDVRPDPLYLDDANDSDGELAV